MNGEKLKTCPARARTRQEFPHYHFHLTQYWKSRQRNYSREKKNKRHPHWKGRSQIILVHRRHDIMFRKTEKTPSKTVIIDEQIQ